MKFPFMAAAALLASVLLTAPCAFAESALEIAEDVVKGEESVEAAAEEETDAQQAAQEEAQEEAALPAEESEPEEPALAMEAPPGTLEFDMATISMLADDESVKKNVSELANRR
jgi:hypothetical protein